MPMPKVKPDDVIIRISREQANGIFDFLMAAASLVKTGAYDAGTGVVTCEGGALLRDAFSHRAHVLDLLFEGLRPFDLGLSPAVNFLDLFEVSHPDLAVRDVE